MDSLEEFSHILLNTFISSVILTLWSGEQFLFWHGEYMIERWAIIFGEVLVMMSIAILVGVLPLPIWLAILGILLGGAGIGIGFVGGELPARNYFQVLALMAGFSLVMALGALLTGSSTLLGIPLTVGSFSLFIIVVAAAFFAGFEPEAVEPGQEELDTELAVLV